MKHGRICTVCGKEYAYCNNCSQYDAEPRWKFLFCSENCMSIFEIVSKYNRGELNARQAKNLLSGCDIKKAGKLDAGTKEAIEKINAETMPKKIQAKEKEVEQHKDSE